MEFNICLLLFEHLRDWPWFLRMTVDVPVIAFKFSEEGILLLSEKCGKHPTNSDTLPHERIQETITDFIYGVSIYQKSSSK